MFSLKTAGIAYTCQQSLAFDFYFFNIQFMDASCINADSIDADVFLGRLNLNSNKQKAPQRNTNAVKSQKLGQARRLMKQTKGRKIKLQICVTYKQTLLTFILGLSRAREHSLFKIINSNINNVHTLFVD